MVFSNYLTNLKEHSKDSDGLLVILLVLVIVVTVVDKMHLHREPATIHRVLGAPGVLRPPVEVELLQLVGVVQGAAAHHPHPGIQREMELLRMQRFKGFICRYHIIYQLPTHRRFPVVHQLLSDCLIVPTEGECGGACVGVRGHDVDGGLVQLYAVLQGG